MVEGVNYVYVSRVWGWRERGLACVSGAWGLTCDSEAWGFACVGVCVRVVGAR